MDSDDHVQIVLDDKPLGWGSFTDLPIPPSFSESVRRDTQHVVSCEPVHEAVTGWEIKQFQHCEDCVRVYRERTGEELRVTVTVSAVPEGSA